MQEGQPEITPLEYDEEYRPRLAARELLRRRRARHSLVEYARSVEIPGVPVTDDENEVLRPVETSMAIHHRKMLEAMERTIEKPMGRLMVFAPPGSAKSSYASVVAPAWCVSKWEQYRVIQGSYGAKQAAKQSRRARQLCRTPLHRAIWADRPMLNPESRAADAWELTNGSQYMSAGFQTGITGNRADLFIIDDPFKNREEADSPVMREKVESEYYDSVTTRAKPGMSIIAIFTRWHPLDLGGMILPDDYDGRSGMVLCKDGQWWEILNIPAKAEHEDDPLGRDLGEYLWPEWWPKEHWAQWENNPRAARTWAALYQQRPSLGEGLEFKREWFRWYDPDVPVGTSGGRPKDLVFYGASDYATLEDKGDFTEHGVCGIDEKRNFVWTDWWYGQKTTDVTVAEWATLCQRNRPKAWWHEGGPIGNAIGPALRDTMRRSNPAFYTSLKALTSIKNKATKLNVAQKVAAEGRMWLPLKRPWATRVVDQLCAFPAVKHDDACDLVGLLCRGIDEMINPWSSTAEKRKGIKPFSVAWLEMEGDGTELTPRHT
jgi:predicted phage terminase large subunit-like protein